jgi:hypothetical protein
MGHHTHVRLGRAPFAQETYMLVLKFLVMAVAALVDKIFQSELRPSKQSQARANLRREFYRVGGE